jgi:hypothetical protein
LMLEPLEDRLLLSIANSAAFRVQGTLPSDATASIPANPRVESIPSIYRELLREIRPAAAMLEATHAADRETASHSEWHEGEMLERIEHFAWAITRVSREEAAATSVVLDSSAEREPRSRSITPLPLAFEQQDQSLLPQPPAPPAGPLADPALLHPHPMAGSSEFLEPAIMSNLAFLSEGIPIESDQPAALPVQAQWLMQAGGLHGLGPVATVPLKEAVAFDLPELQRTVADFLTRLAALGDPQSTSGMSGWLVAVAIVGAGAALEAARVQNRLARRSALHLANGWAPESFVRDQT